MLIFVNSPWKDSRQSGCDACPSQGKTPEHICILRAALGYNIQEFLYSWPGWSRERNGVSCIAAPPSYKGILQSLRSSWSLHLEDEYNTGNVFMGY